MQGYSFHGSETRGARGLVHLGAIATGTAPVALSQLAQLTRLADTHGLLPLLRERALACSHAHDPGAAALRDRALREAALEARRNTRLAHALERLAAAGVPALLFKGTALAHRHYARPELRPRDDTDLLVRPEHVPVAGAVLARLGLRPVAGVEGSLIMRQRLYRARDADGVLHNLDLHWAVSNSVRSGALAPRALMARAVSLPPLGQHAFAPCDEDALLIACLHLDAHHAGQVRLVWLFDVHLLLKTLDLEARDRAATAAVDGDLAGACAWVLRAAREALGTRLDGFDAVLTAAPGRAPSPVRAAQWLRELARLPDARTRAAWLGQHLFPPLDALQARHGAAPAWRLYGARMLRGMSHLLGR